MMRDKTSAFELRTSAQLDLTTPLSPLGVLPRLPGRSLRPVIGSVLRVTGE